MADDRFFHKTNDSDATQFAILYPSIGAHRASPLRLQRHCTDFSGRMGRFLDSFPARSSRRFLSIRDHGVQGNECRLQRVNTVVNPGLLQRSDAEMTAEAGEFKA